MPALNFPFRIFYVAKNFTTGLTDVGLYVRRPDGVREGAFIMTEINDPYLSGSYYYDYLPTQQGYYLFAMDSPSQPKRAEKSIEVLRNSPFAIF